MMVEGRVSDDATLKSGAPDDVLVEGRDRLQCVVVEGRVCDDAKLEPRTPDDDGLKSGAPDDVLIEGRNRLHSVMVEGRVSDDTTLDSGAPDDVTAEEHDCPQCVMVEGRVPDDETLESGAPEDVFDEEHECPQCMMVEGRVCDNATLHDRQVAMNVMECEESMISLQDDDDDLTTDGGRVLAESVPTFGTTVVNNSSDIHFGNKTFYQGPVTIKQMVYANSKESVKEGDPCPAITDKAPEDLASRRRRCVAWTVTLSITLVLSVSVTLLISLITKTGLGGTETSASTSDSGELVYNRPNSTYDVRLTGKLRILPRKEWLAQPPNSPHSHMKLPVPYVIISHTATEPCYSQADCVFAVRTAQTFHIESKGWADIAYNFLVGGDGYVYTGRGWDAVGAHTYGFNRCALGVSLVGTFVQEHPPAGQFAALLKLLEEGVRLGKIRPDYKLVGHCQLSRTLSPGQALMDDLKALPHWLSKPVECAQVGRLFQQELEHHNSSTDSPLSVTV